jgi:hypothetical protein
MCLRGTPVGQRAEHRAQRDAGEEVDQQDQRDRPAGVKSLVSDQHQRHIGGAGAQFGLELRDEESAQPR